MVEKITEKLESRLGECYSEIVEIMKKTQAVLTGSFVLESLYQEKWTDVDLDFFVPIRGKYQEGFDEYGVDNKFRYLSELSLYLQKCGCNGQIIGGQYQNQVRNEIVSVSEFDLNGTKIQVINVDLDSSEMKEFIKTYFDIDIVKNLYWYPDSENLEYYSHYPEDIESRRTHLNPTSGTILKLDRCKKYIERHIYFDLTQETFDRLYSSVIDDYQRKNKSKACGLFNKNNQKKNRRYALYDILQVFPEGRQFLHPGEHKKEIVNFRNNLI